MELVLMGNVIIQTQEYCVSKPILSVLLGLFISTPAFANSASSVSFDKSTLTVEGVAAAKLLEAISEKGRLLENSVCITTYAYRNISCTDFQSHASCPRAGTANAFPTSCEIKVK